MLKQLEFPQVRRDTGEPSATLARCVGILVQLLTMGTVDFAWYARHFERSERQFTRDLQHLRSVGSELGLTISKRENGRARLADFKGRNVLRDDATLRDEALRAVARALGAPAALELGTTDDGEEPAAAPFLIYGFPRLLPGTPVAQTFAELKAAHRAGARVRFRYADRNGTPSYRTVEPYRVRAHSGRYYLVAYDLAPRKGWRYFALDRITAKITRAGSFKPRPIPSAYVANDALGMLQRGAATTEVTIRLSAAVAVSTASRVWQREQRVIHRRDGAIDVILTLNDIEEGVRWALGFGGEARVVAPARAVAIARRRVGELQALYGARTSVEERAAG